MKGGGRTTGGSDKAHTGRFSLRGGAGNPAATDNPQDYYLPQSVRDKLSRIQNIQSYNELKEYLRTNGIELETGEVRLKGEMGDAKLPMVAAAAQKIAVGVETYKALFGNDALSKLKTITLIDNTVVGQGGYVARLLGEKKSSIDGTLRLRDLNVTGHEIFHELAHAFQDSQAKRGEDILTYSSRAVREMSLSSSQTAYFGAREAHLQAERYADAFADGFTRGTRDGIAFIRSVYNHKHK